MKEVTEIETKVPIPAGKLREVLDRFGTLGDGRDTFFCENKEDVYFRDEHNDIGYDKKVLRVRSIIKSVPCSIRRTDKIFTDQGLGDLEENDIDSFLDYAFSFNELKTKNYITAKLKSIENGYENNIEQEVSISDRNCNSIYKLFKTLGFKRKFSKRKFSILYTFEFAPFNVEIVYVSRDSNDKNGVWYVEIETTEELQCSMGTYDWKINDYEEHICDIFKQLGLDPATKDNRNWQEILGIENE